MNAHASRVDIRTADGVADAILAVPEVGADEGPWPGVLVFMDAFGPRPRLEEMAARVAAAGYVVVVPNLFYRHGRAPVVELPDLTVPENRSAVFEKLYPLMASLTPDLAMRDAASYLDFLGADDRVAAGPVATVGYCMGGALALRTAARFPDRVAAVGGEHPRRLATDAHDTPQPDLGDKPPQV
jgi:carboxymethylenebutenolidase